MDAFIAGLQGGTFFVQKLFALVHKLAIYETFPVDIILGSSRALYIERYRMQAGGNYIFRKLQKPVSNTASSSTYVSTHLRAHVCLWEIEMHFSCKLLVCLKFKVD